MSGLYWVHVAFIGQIDIKYNFLCNSMQSPVIYIQQKITYEKKHIHASLIKAYDGMHDEQLL